MPPRQWKLRVTDILEAIYAIQEYVKEKDRESFLADRKTMDAVERRFITIGEAAANVPEGIVQAHPELPWDDMRRMRNIVAHVYFGVSHEVLWRTIQNDLPGLPPLLRKLLDEPD